jgi:MoaA/NifB/PqqE/SkfB family radical SAM enzyme
MPEGNALPCCVASDSTKFGNTNNLSIKEIINGENMKQLRYNMLHEIKSNTCHGCYKHEEQHIRSARESINQDYRQYFDTDVADNVSIETGELAEFRMRYFDIRFSNICNFKCRTCDSNYSSQWEQETKTFFSDRYIPISTNKDPKLIEEIKTHIPYMSTAYFAGGEPLITEEHYVLLEEMIKTRAGEINLIYNTNLSNLKYKNKDILTLWKYFKHVDISASVDHQGSRAEYIRHGTDWETQLDNIRKISSLPYIQFSMNSVISVFNYTTIASLYELLIQEKILTTTSNPYGLYNMINPDYFSATILPKEIKEYGTQKLNEFVKFLERHNFHSDQINQINSCIDWVNSRNDWETHKEQFKNRIQEIDQVRNESFVKTFPELKSMMTD